MRRVGRCMVANIPGPTLAFKVINQLTLVAQTVLVTLTDQSKASRPRPLQCFFFNKLAVIQEPE